MKMTALSCSAFIISGGLLAACGSQPIGSPRAMLQAQAMTMHAERGASWMLREAKSEPLVYISYGPSVGIYAYNGKQVGSLGGLANTLGLCSDGQGDVWVTNGGELLEYTHAGTIPIAEVFTPGYEAASGCAVDLTSGDLAVSSRDLLVYKNASGTPQVYADPDMSFFAYCGYDNEGNLFVNGAKGRRSAVQLAELPSGGSALGTIKLQNRIERVGEVQWDGQYLAVGDSLGHVVYQLSVSNGRATTETTTHFYHWRLHNVEQSWILNGIIVFPFSKREVGFWKFPAGNKLAHSFIINAYTRGGTTISAAPSN